METIILEKGETLYREPNRVVCESGEYEPTDLVLVGELDNPLYTPDFPLYQYQAHYVKFGTVFQVDQTL